MVYHLRLQTLLIVIIIKQPTFHRSHIQPAAVQDAVSTNRVAIHDVEMNHDEVSQIYAKHRPAMLETSSGIAEYYHQLQQTCLLQNHVF